MAYTRDAHSPTSNFSSSFERISVMLHGLCQRLEAEASSRPAIRMVLPGVPSSQRDANRRLPSGSASSGRSAVDGDGCLAGGQRAQGVVANWSVLRREQTGSRATPPLAADRLWFTPARTSMSFLVPGSVAIVMALVEPCSLHVRRARRQVSQPRPESSAARRGWRGG